MKAHQSAVVYNQPTMSIGCVNSLTYVIGPPQIVICRPSRHLFSVGDSTSIASAIDFMVNWEVSVNEMKGYKNIENRPKHLTNQYPLLGGNSCSLL